MPEMKTLNGYEVVDAKAREQIETLDMNCMAVLDITSCNKRSDGTYLPSDSVKAVLQRLYNGEIFPMWLKTYKESSGNAIYKVPSIVTVTSADIKIKVDQAHLHSSGTILRVEQDEYIFTGTASLVIKTYNYTLPTGGN